MKGLFRGSGERVTLGEHRGRVSIPNVLTLPPVELISRSKQNWYTGESVREQVRNVAPALLLVAFLARTWPGNLPAKAAPQAIRKTLASSEPPDQHRTAKAPKKTVGASGS